MALDAVLALVVQPAKVAGLGCTAKPIQVPAPRSSHDPGPIMPRRMQCVAAIAVCDDSLLKTRYPKALAVA
jgi:hypothetical protein